MEQTIKIMPLARKQSHKGCCVGSVHVNGTTDSCTENSLHKVTKAISLLSLLLSVLTSVNLFAQTNKNIGGIDYILYTDTKTATVTCGTGTAELTSAPATNSYTGAVVIPATVNDGTDDYDVTKIGAFAFANSTITSVKVESVKYIDTAAFAYCTKLQDVDLKITVYGDTASDQLGKGAFNGVTTLNNLTIEGTAQEGMDPFANNDGTRTNINFSFFDRTNSDGSKKANSEMTINGKVTISNCVLLSAALKSVIFKGDVEIKQCKVNGGAFSFSKFTSANGISFTDKSLLRGHSLSRVTADKLQILGESRTSLGNDGKSSSVTVFAENEYNGNYKGYDRKTHGKIKTVNETIVNGQNESFTAGASLTHIVIGDGCYIAPLSFWYLNDKYGASKLTKLEIGDNVVIGADAFLDRTNLETLIIGHNVEFEAGVLEGCTAIKNIYINSSVPPTLDGNSTALTDLTAMGVDLKIHVRCPADVAFKTQEPWKTLFNDANHHIVYDNNEDHTYNLHTVLGDCECYDADGNTVYYNGDITIKNGGSLAFSDPAAAQKHFKDEYDNNIILERDLSVDDWHLLGYMGNIPSGTTYGTLFPDAESYDYAVLPFVANDWRRKADATGNDIYAYADDELIKDQSFMVWPFPYGWDDASKDAKSDPISGTPKLVITKDGNNLAEFNKYGDGATDDGDFIFNLTNDGTESTQETDPTGTIHKGYWFPIYNPYVGRLDVEKFFAVNSSSTGIQGGYIYLYKPTSSTSTTDWTAINSTNLSSEDYKYILPARGFMVATTDETNKKITVKLKRDMIDVARLQTEEEHNYNFKAGKQTNGMEFTIATDEARATATARYNAEASDGFDANDAYIMLSDGKDKLVEPYFVVDNRQIFDNHFSSLPYETEMRFHAAKQSHVDLTVSNIPASINVSVIDIATGEETQLTDGEKFSFVADEGENANRYKVKFYNSGVSIEDVNNTVADVRFTQNDKRVTIFGEGLQNVEVVNTLGQVVSSESVSGNEAQITINGNAGAYIVRVKTSNGTAIEKFIVK